MTIPDDVKKIMDKAQVFDEVSKPSFTSFLLSKARKACDVGIVGDAVDLIGPHTEADPWVVRASVLTWSSALIGDRPRIRVGFGNYHPPRLYFGIVGKTGQGRKGMGWSEVEYLADEATTDLDFAADHVLHGLASGEGTVQALKDLDQDKRLLVYEPELDRLLSAMGRDGSTLSPIVRQLWDSGVVHVPTRKDPLKVSGAHMALMAHVTPDELRLKMRASDMANGFGNRFIWLGVKRSAVRPFGSSIDTSAVTEVAVRWRGIIDQAAKVTRVGWADRDARDLWSEWYHAQAAQQERRIGMDAAAHGRWEAQALRLAMLYGLLAGRDEISTADLLAAWTVLAHSDLTLAGIWPRSATGTPEADELLDAIREAGGYLERSKITVKHKTAAQGHAVAQILIDLGLARWGRQETAGRTADVLILTDVATKEGSK